MKTFFNNPKIVNALEAAEFGIEKESLRIDQNGRLAQTPHMFAENEHLSRDFCENQIEFITDVFNSADGVLNQLRQLHTKVNQKLRDADEFLWCFSNPPKVDSMTEIPIAQLGKEKTAYRRYLAEKYGKAKMLYSGIHLNFSFPKQTLNILFDHSNENDFFKFTNKLYTSLSKKLIRYCWLIVYLTAASPVIDDSFLTLAGFDNSVKGKYASFRCGKLGYWNFFTPILDFSSLDGYADSIQSLINQHKVNYASELYYPVRLKSGGKSTIETLLANGITHIELRMLDVNPLSDVGIFKEDIQFVHLLLLYLLSIEDTPFEAAEQLTAIENIKSAAQFDDESALINGISLRKAAEQELQNISEFSEKHFSGFQHIIDYQQNKLTSGNRYAEIIKKDYGEEYLKKGMALAAKYRG